MWHECITRRTTSFNLKNNQYLFSFTLNSLWRKINVEKILKLWENCCFIFNFNHILKFKNFRVWQNYPPKKESRPEIHKVSKRQRFRWVPSNTLTVFLIIPSYNMSSNLHFFFATHTKHFMDTHSLAIHSFLSFVGPSSIPISTFSFLWGIYWHSGLFHHIYSTLLF